MSLEEITRLLDSGTPPITQNEISNALSIAATKNRRDIVLLLLERGADVNTVAGDYGTALTAAASNKSLFTVPLTLGILVILAVLVSVPGIVFETPYGTELAVIAMAAMVVATVIGTLGHGAKPFTAASRSRGMVLLLLSRGADINLVGGRYGTALAAAACSGDIFTLRLLLARGADINIIGGEYGTALAAAVYSGSGLTMSILLDQGVDINMVGGKYGTALAAAACIGDDSTVRSLLERGADTNIISGEYGTALAAAAYNGRYAIVLLLLDRGANINIVGGEYGTVLAAAVLGDQGGVRGGVLAIVALRVWEIHDRYRALLTTVFGPRAELLPFMTYILLISGFATAIQIMDTTPKIIVTAIAALLVTCVSEDKMALKGVMPLLLSRGADTNLRGGKYGTALGAAVFKLSKDTVSLLVDHGADVNLVTGEFGTALGQAIYQGSTEIALFLLDHGADVMHVGGINSNSLGVYPSALDIAYLEGSKADPTLLARLRAAIGERNTPVDDVISRPPFPMPYSALCTNHYRGTFSPTVISSFDILATQFRTGDNLTPEQTDIPCKELNEEALWHSLAALVGLHEDTTRVKRQWILNDVCYFLACNYDFGLAYAAARVAWKLFNDHSSNVISIHRDQWRKNAQVLDEARSKAIQIDSDSNSGRVQELIISPYSVMPRRLWDLKSNRVVNFRMLHATQSTTETTPTFWAVTHSWTSDMSPVWTAINQHQWPVPLPKDISLEYLRSELLALGAEYVWIDVLCLRQRSKVDYLEQLRQEEWKIDVPTIGNIYRAATNIIRYFNGLGVSFSINNWDSPQHWLQRAWTLQEISSENTTINGGILRDSGTVFLDSLGQVSGKTITLRSAIRPVIQLAAQVDSQYGCEVYELAREMSRRHASQPVDKLSGLFYLLHTTKLPCYDAKRTSEDFWRECFRFLPSERKAEILLSFPYRGSDEQWFPTWAQILDWPVRDPDYDHKRSKVTSDSIKNISGEMSLWISNIWTVSDVVFNETGNQGKYKAKLGTLLLGFHQPHLLQKPIDIQNHPVFTLATADLGHAYNWVVCRAVDKQVGDLGVTECKVLKKVGVIRTDSISELLVSGLPQKTDCLFV